uniref:GYF domain-containing protein n=1 Tax=Pyramimonas obovata TaxID=1411642 RepID=A0A7S0R4W1_9CHLO|mmetsp:Transcript_25569/g.55567  ORF Transcript_25569/g.55567 Transcript_25569/m.55567 type:complete len:181 (+) Transcript_25569:141-683(+)|eukprot:CAMPEP_0118935072 /NCGR_PEP_ID=MMETSP1169-20130426/14861_1 /TAXON_ID=36882 /ORGANISM="Pyramimonas obovata, Strain CCMP722" /LENGTH=180 /DNA_ID=CAMNT_0006878055 /DNA_START=131 /DNA_END=673 /DNA_ORIENTATION=+
MASRLERLQEKSAEVKPSKPSNSSKPFSRDGANKQLKKDEWEANNYAFLALEDNIWYYRDRASVPRGPAPISTLRQCWINGMIDRNTLVWGQGLEEWVPLRNVRALPQLIHNFETVFLTNLNRAVSAFMPKRAHRQAPVTSAPASAPKSTKGTKKGSASKKQEAAPQVAPACLSLAFPIQ